jgi:quercetin dioxygenase-like cupin family protein
MSKDDVQKALAEAASITPYVGTGGLWSVMELEVPAGGGPPPHAHLFENEGFCILEGSFCFWIGNDEPRELKTGEYAYGPRNIWHFFRNVGDCTGRLLLIFTPGGCENYFRELEEARRDNGDDLREREEAIDKKYGIVIDRRS